MSSSSASIAAAAADDNEEYKQGEAVERIQELQLLLIANESAQQELTQQRLTLRGAEHTEQRAALLDRIAALADEHAELQDELAELQELETGASESQ